MNEKDFLNEILEQLTELRTQMYLTEKYLQAQINDLDNDRIQLEERLEDELLDLELRTRKLEKEIEELRKELKK